MHSPLPPTAAEAEAPEPLVTVVVPVFDAAQFVGEAIESVLAQTYSRFEIILVNDGSQDAVALERNLAPFRTAITYLVQENLGAGAARNAAIRAGRGELIAFLDGDDVWYPEFLASQVRFLKRGGFGMVYANALLFGDHPEAGLEYMQTTPSRGEVTLRSLLNQDCHPLTSGTLLRRTSLDGVGLFDPSLIRGQDFELWLRLAHAGVRIGYQKTVLLKYRIRPGSLSGNAIERAQRELRIFEQVREKLALDPENGWIVNRQIHRLGGRLEIEKGKARLVVGDYAGARAHFRAAGWRRGGVKMVAVRLLCRIAPGLLRRIHARYRAAGE